MPADLRLTAAATLLLAGCTTEVAQQPAGDAGIDVSAEAMADGTAEAMAESAVDEAGPEASVDAWVKPDVQEIAANREVRFHVKNEGGLPLFLALKGMKCRSWQVEQQDGSDWKMLALSLMNKDEPCSCQAACDSPGNEDTNFEEVAPGTEKVVPWDGRSYVTWVEEHPCSWGHSSSWTTVEGVQQPVAPGHYRVTVGLEALLPNYCSYEEAYGQWWCTLTWQWAEAPGIEKMCPANLPASAEFDIPDTGDVDVTISFPKPGPCEPVGTWEVTAYKCDTMAPPKDRIALVEDADGGVTGTMTTHVPADAGSPAASSSVTMNPSMCQFAATTSSTWTSGDAPQCDLRELVAELHGDTGYGAMKHTFCNGHAPESDKAWHETCTAVLERK